MLLKLIHTIPVLRRFYINYFGPRWVGKKISFFESFLSGEDSILDIGAGGGLITKSLREKDFRVTPLDIKNLSYYSEVIPVLYEGNEIPFEENEYDVGLLLSILHHTENPEEILREAIRVARRLIIIEDVYDSAFQKWLTLFVDKYVVNWGFSHCPQTNKSDKEWKALFEKNGLNLISVRYKMVLIFFKQATYHLEKR